VGLPEAVRLGVAGHLPLALEDRDLEAGRVETHVPGQELPGEGDRLLLEVVAEGEVPEHLEKVWWRAVTPTFSRSLCLPPARTHFWEDVALV
jgi:hypothetical protein